MKDILLPEIVALGIYNAELAVKNKNISPNRKTTMFELELPIGTGGVSYINDNSHPISENVIILAKPGQIRHTRLPFKCYYVHMIINEGVIFDVLSSLPDYIEMQDTGEIKEIFTSLCEYYSTGFFEDYIMIQGLILRLVHILNIARRIR